jgi:hypothetical protein
MALDLYKQKCLKKLFRYQAPISAEGMQYIFDFTLTGNTYFNGKVLQVSYKS